jgi:septal ring factor EnvC (AmiA/AmiB activator)
MIGLDQIKLLESKVNKAVEQIRVLREENKALKRSVEKSQSRLQELEGLVARFRSDQEEIEQGILRALKNLDKLEDEVTSRGSRKEAAATTAAAPAASPPGAPPAAQPAVPPPQPASPAKSARAPEPSHAEPAEGPVVDAAEDDAQAGAPEEQLDIF